MAVEKVGPPSHNLEQDASAVQITNVYREERLRDRITYYLKRACFSSKMYQIRGSLRGPWFSDQLGLSELLYHGGCT